jgi:hypothetical protein
MTSALKQWIINHDDKKLFTYLYIGSAVVLSIAISLFWLIVVVGIHLGLEAFKQFQIDSHLGFALIRSLWEVLLDIALIIFSFVLVLYLDVVLGAAGIGAAARIGVQTASNVGVRFAGFQRAIRGILLSLDDILHISKSFLKSKSENDEDNQEDKKLGGWSGSWSAGDLMTVIFLILSFIFLLLAPTLLEESLINVYYKVISELHPLGG